MTVATVLRGIVAAGPLVDRDRRLQALDQIDVGPFQLMEELPGVDREAFDVLPLPFGVERVEGQRALARAAGAGDDDEPVAGDIEVEILQIVHPRPADADALVGVDSDFGTLTVHAAPERVEYGDLKLFSLTGTGARRQADRKNVPFRTKIWLEKSIKQVS